jgi:8-oxo-dGTP pyrophosphatase MutT (NUDIX family)/GNAT superfamily N-acetyltransferase
MPMLGGVRFDLVRERVAALPRELPAPPAILTPVRIDSPEPLFPAEPARRGVAAAVLVLLFPDEEGQARVLLTARASHGVRHPGEVSFPGGHAEPTDADPVATALREAAEEVGLDPAACGLRVAGALERPHVAVSGYLITPIVAVADRRPRCRAAPDEVARIIEAPVEAFLPDAPVELEERVIRERLIRYGVYPVEGERVWGATARMLGQLGAVLATEETESKEKAPLEPAGPTEAAPRPQAAGPAESTGPAVRPAADADRPAIEAFLAALAPELAHALPPASQTLLAETAGRLAGLASWAPWDRERGPQDPRGFDGLTLADGEPAAELTLLAVAPDLRGRGIGRSLDDAIAAAARSAGRRRLLAWTLADTAIHPSAAAARAFFRSSGFTDLAVDRRVLARGEDRLLLSRSLD